MMQQTMMCQSTAVAPVQVQPSVTVQMSGPSQVGPKPSLVNCPTCRKSVLTNVSYKSVGKTHCIACCLCLFGCWPCVCLPYIMKSCRDADHTCPGCNAYMGVYKA